MRDAVRKRWKALSGRWKLFISLVLAFVLYLSVFSTIFYVETLTALEGRNSPLDTVRGSIVHASELEAAKPISVLLLGVDGEEEDVGRSDSIVVIALNAKESKTMMLSIPRDTFVPIPGYREDGDKLNHAYAYGGEELTRDVVEKLLDIQIDYVVRMGMDGLPEVIELLGGIKVDNPFMFTYSGETFEEGVIELSAEQVLKYVRMRYDDPDGDGGRQARQLQVVEEVLKGLATPEMMRDLPALQQILHDHLRMNMTWSDVLVLHHFYHHALDEVEHLQFTKGYGMRKGGIYYDVLDDDELAHVRKRLAMQLAE